MMEGKLRAVTQWRPFILVVANGLLVAEAV